jgi:hypothetical protein
MAPQLASHTATGTEAIAAFILKPGEYGRNPNRRKHQGNSSNGRLHPFILYKGTNFVNRRLAQLPPAT